VPESQGARGIQWIGVGAIPARTGPLDELQAHTGTGPQHDGSYGRLVELELFDDLVQAECLLVPGALRVEIRYGQAGVVHVQSKVGHDDLPIEG